MAQVTITISNCSPSPNPATVHDGDMLQFCSADRAYQVTGLGNVLGGAHGRVDVPAGGCSAFATVTGTPRPNQGYGYNIGPNCPPQGPPEIIIDDNPVSRPAAKKPKGYK